MTEEATYTFLRHYRVGRTNWGVGSVAFSQRSFLCTFSTCPVDSTKALFHGLFKTLIVELHELRECEQSSNTGREGGGGLKTPGKGSTSGEQSRVHLCPGRDCEKREVRSHRGDARARAARGGAARLCEPWRRPFGESSASVQNQSADLEPGRGRPWLGDVHRPSGFSILFFFPETLVKMSS